METNEYRYGTLRYSAKLDRMVDLRDEDTLPAKEAEDYVGLHCGCILEYLAIRNGAAEWVPSRIDRRIDDDATTTRGWYIVGLAASIDGRAVRFRM